MNPTSGPSSSPAPSSPDSQAITNFARRKKDEISFSTKDARGGIKEIVAREKIGTWDRLFSSYKLVKLTGLPGNGVYIKVDQIASALGLTVQRVKQMSDEEITQQLIANNQRFETRTMSMRVFANDGNPLELKGKSRIEPEERLNYTLVSLPGLQVYMERNQLKTALGLTDAQLNSMDPSNVGLLLLQKKQEYEERISGSFERTTRMIGTLFTTNIITPERALEADRLKQLNLRRALTSIGRVVTVEQFTESMTRMANKIKPNLIFNTLLAIGRELALHSGKSIQIEARPDESLGFLITEDKKVFIQGSNIASGASKDVSEAIPLQSDDSLVWASIRNARTSSGTATPSILRDSPVAPVSSPPAAAAAPSWMSLISSLFTTPSADQSQAGGTLRVTGNQAPHATIRFDVAPSPSSSTQERLITLRDPQPRPNAARPAQPASVPQPVELDQTTDVMNEVTHVVDGAAGQPVVDDNPEAGPVVRSYLPHVEESDIAGVAREEEVLKIIKKKRIPHVITPYTISVLTPGTSGSSPARLVMIQERFGRVSELLEPNSTASLDDFLLISQHIAEAASGLHANELVHMDIKPANILVKRNPRNGSIEEGVMADFGTCLEAGRPIIGGTPNFLPPEVTITKSTAPSVDAYSFGVTLFNLITGLPGMLNAGGRPIAFSDATQSQIDAFINGLINKINTDPRFSTNKAKAIAALRLCQGLIKLNPTERLTCQEASTELARIRTTV